MLSTKKLLYKIVNALQPLIYASPTTGWSAIYNDYTKAKRRGKVVTVKGNSAGGGITLTAGDYKDITTLPADFRPSEGVYFCPASIGGTHIMTGMITTGGVVKIYSNQASSYWAFSVTYIVD